MNRQNFFALMLTCIGLLSTSQAVVQASNDTYTISILYDGSNRIMVNDKIVRDGVTYQFHPEGNWGIVFNYGLPVQCVIAGGYFEAIGFEGNVKMRDEFTASRYTNSILTASKENVIFEVRIVHSPDKISPEHDLEVYFDQNTTLSYTRHFPIKNPSKMPESSHITSITLPSSWTMIPNKCFFGCEDLEAVSLPTSITKIGWEAFWGCKKLRSINLPNSVTSIDKNAFRGCKSLLYIDIPCGVKNIEEGSFYDCGLVNVVLPETVTTIGFDAFSNCHDLKEIIIPNTTTSIESGAFAFCYNLDLFIPENVSYIGSGNDFKSVIVADDNKYYDSRNNCNAIIETSTNKLIAACNKTILPLSVVKIGWSAYSFHKGLDPIVLHEGIKAIESWAFCYIESSNVSLPSTLESIGEYAFLGTYNLSKITSNIEIPFDISDKTFSAETYERATLYVPAGTKRAYEETVGWSSFKTIIEIRESTVPGDVNEDGVVDDEDMAAIADYVLGRKTAGVDMQSADVNNDGTVDVKDITFTISKAHFRLPITGSGISFTPSGAVDIEFTDTKEAFLLSDVLDWSEGDSYTVYFSKPAPDTGIRIGNEEIPGGLTSYHGTTPLQKNIHWEASNGQKFEKTFAWLMISAISPGKLHISDVVINKAGGEAIHCSYPFGKNGQAISRFYHVEADTGEEFEQYVDAFCKCSKIAYLSGKVTFNNADSYIGGANWAAGKRIYELKLNNPTETDNLVWKYVTKNGVTRYQQIEKSVTESSIKVEEDISECYITLSPNANGSHTEVLDIQSICSKPY